MCDGCVDIRTPWWLDMMATLRGGKKVCFSPRKNSLDVVDLQQADSGAAVLAGENRGVRARWQRTIDA